MQAQALPNLNYTQAFILLGVPEEERAQFIAEIDVESIKDSDIDICVINAISPTLSLPVDILGYQKNEFEEKKDLRRLTSKAFSESSTTPWMKISLICSKS